MRIIIDQARIVTMTGLIHEEGYVVLEDGIIAAVDAGAPDPVWFESLAGRELQRIHAAGGWLLPGFVDAHCHVGLFDDGLVIEGDDGNEGTDPVTPQLQAIDGIFQDDRCFSEGLAAGVTSVMTGPGSANVLAGRFALLHTIGRTVDDMTQNRHAAMKAALGENPKRVHGQHKDRSPATRMAIASVLRESLVRAAWYRAEKKRKPEETAPDLRWEALLPVLSGQQLIKFHAHRSDDILTALRLADEFGLRYTLDHCTEGYLIADILADTYRRGLQDGYGCGIQGCGRLEGVITGPLLTDRGKPELNRSTLTNPARLAATGIPVAIMTDHPVIPIQYLPVSAALAARAGLPEELALAAITSTAAGLCDAADRIGRIRVGYQADLSLFDTHPLDFRCRTQRVFIQGRPVFIDAGV